LLKGGLKELYGYYGKHIGHVYFQEEYEVTPTVSTAAAIFRVTKS
jgi:hypothetical protein